MSSCIYKLADITEAKNRISCEELIDNKIECNSLTRWVDHNDN